MSCAVLSFLWNSIFAYLLEYSWLRNQYSQSFCGHSGTRAEQRKIWVPWHVCSQLRSNRVTFSSCFNFHTVNKGPFCSLCSTMFFFHFCAFCWWFHRLKWPPSVMLKYLLVLLSTRRLWSVLEEKKYTLDKLCFSMSYNAIGHEFNINESTLYIKQVIFKQQHI